MEDLKQDLKLLGWNLSSEGISICEQDLSGARKNNSRPSCQQIINHALNFDLNEIGEKVLPDDLGKGKLNEFCGPCVLQVMKVRNASAPKANEESSVAPRLLQIHLSDGHRTCIAVEQSSFGKELSINTPPGSKVCLNGSMKFRNGFLLLDSKNIRLLGGQVDSLYNKWKSAKDAGGFFRSMADGDEVPPPFVQFGTEINSRCDTSNPSLQGLNGKGDANSDDKGFSEQRQTAIAKVKESMGDATGKSFVSRNKADSESPAQFRKFDDRSNAKNFNDTQSRNDGYKKPGNSRVDEDKCEQICQMGFSRPSAYAALRRNNNNLDEAVDSLLSSKQPKFTRNESREPRGNSRGRGGRKFNRGGRSANNDQDQSYQSSNVSLFDYVETKMTSSANNAKPQSQKSSGNPPEKDLPSTSSASSQPSYPLDDDALQEEYIMEYVKELSLVETRGESSDQRQQHEEPQTSETNPENSGVNKYRSGGNRFSLKKRNDDNFESRNDSRKFQSSRTKLDQSGSDRFSQGSDSGRFDNRKANRFNDSQTDSDRPSNSRNFSNFDRRRTRERDNDFPEQARYNDKNNYSKRYNDTPHYNSYNNRKSNRNDSESNPRSPQKSFQQQQRQLPPRLQRQLEKREKQQTGEQTHDPKRVMTLGETNKQLLREERSSSLDSADLYPIYSNEKAEEKTKSSPSHSYQDQRQQNRNSAGRRNENPRYNGPRKRSERFTEHEEGIRWKPGMFCQAIYWEDGQYYKAEVTNVHPSEPTAVVKFVGYENCEEVYFTDMRPDKSMRIPFPDRGSYDGPTDGLEFTRGHKGPTRYPREREKRGPTRPSRTLYQPPTPAQN